MTNAGEEVARRSPCAGHIAAVKPRIILHRSFDEIWHSYKGYVLVIDDLRVAIGPAAQERHAFRIGDEVAGTVRPRSSVDRGMVS